MTRMFLEMAESSPLNEESVAGWLEQRLPPEVIAKGRPRFEKLRHREEQKRRVRSDDDQRRGGRNRRLAVIRRDQKAEMTGSGNPKPLETNRKGRGRALADAMSRKPSRALRREKLSPAKQDQNAGRQPRKKSQVKAKAAPPLDEWDKRVDELAGRYQFTEIQRTQAQAILRDLRRRAEQYMLSRADDFAAAERLKDAKARRDKEAQLLEPMGAFFEELTQRLEHLATIEQKARAESTGKKKK